VLPSSDILPKEASVSPARKHNLAVYAKPLTGFSFRDLVNIDKLQSLMEVSCAATGMPSGIIDVFTGEVYAGAGWQDICLHFHRVNPDTRARCIKNDTAILENIKDGKPYGYKCDNGLWDIGVPIYCQGMHVATFFLGQFFYEDERVDRDFFALQAERFGFDREAYLTALDSVPRFSRAKVDEILRYNVALSSFLSDMATQNLERQQELEQRKKAEAELLRLRNYLSNIINSMPSTLIGVDLDGNITQWNDRAEQVSGFSKENVVGKPLVQVIPRFALEVERMHDAIRNRRKEESLKRCCHEKGETRYEDIIIYPLITNGIEGAVIRIDDVTDRVRLEQMMVQSEKMMSVGGLAAGMAHEINNPLAAILGYSHNIKKRVFGDLRKNRVVAEECGISLEDVQNYLKKRDIYKMIDGIHQSGERAATIVSNMLSFSRKSEKHLGMYDLSELLDKTLELAANDYDLKKHYDFRKIEIERDYAPDMPLVHCEGNEIQQVFLNLLRNGAEAMAEKDYGLEAPRFFLRVRSENDMAVVEVEDNGPGMEEYVRKRILEPFYTTKEVGKGTGLGLSVSYFIIADQHGGSMDVQSEPGQWTRFTIKLPIAGEVE